MPCECRVLNRQFNLAFCSFVVYSNSRLAMALSVQLAFLFAKQKVTIARLGCPR